MPSGAGKDGMRPWCQGARHVFCSNCADHTRYLAGGQTGEPPCPRTLHQTRAELYKVFCIGTAVVGALRGCAKEIGKTVCCGQNKLRPALQAQQQRGWARLPRAQRRGASSTPGTATTWVGRAAPRSKEECVQPIQWVAPHQIKDDYRCANNNISMHRPPALPSARRWATGSTPCTRARRRCLDSVETGGKRLVFRAGYTASGYWLRWAIIIKKKARKPVL